MLNKITFQSLIAAPVIAGLSIFAASPRFAVSIIVGAALALVNFRVMARGITGLITVDGAKKRMIVMNFIRLSGILTALILVIYLRLVHVGGLLLGLTIIFIIIIKEGLVYSLNSK